MSLSMMLYSAVCRLGLVTMTSNITTNPEHQENPSSDALVAARKCHGKNRPKVIISVYASTHGGLFFV